MRDGAPVSYLEGVRVLDLGHYIAGPGTCAVLANLGAEVIKVEPPAGELARRVAGAEMVTSFSHSRRSVALDLKQAQGREVLDRLLRVSDVAVQNLRPGTLERLGLDVATIRERYPRLVFVTVTGYPGTGPSAARPGYDIAAQAGSGMMWVTGEADRGPQPVGAAIVDVAATHVAAQAVLAALLRRERTGQGDAIEVSLLEVAVALQAQRFGLYGVTGEPPVRNGGCQSNVAPASEVGRTSDGYIVFSAYLPAHWRILCAVLDRPDLVADPRFADAGLRAANRPALLAELAPRMRTMTSRELITVLAGAGLVAEEVRDYPGVLGCDDVALTGIFRPAADGIPLMGLPYRSAGTQRKVAEPAPAVGAHTVEVLAELGLPADEITALLRAEAAGAADPAVAPAGA